MAAWREMHQTVQELTQALQQVVQGGQRGAGDLHRNFKGMNPPKFCGSSDPDEAEHWVKEIERVFRVMQCSDQEKVLLATFQLERDARAWWEATEVILPHNPITWAEFLEHFNNKYFSDRVQEKKATEFANLKQRGLSVAEYEAQFSRLSRYAPHLIGTERMKAKRFLNGLRPYFIKQLMPLDIHVYAKIVRKAQLLEDADEMVEKMRGRKEPTANFGSYRPGNGKKRQNGIENQSRNKKPREQEKHDTFSPP